MKKEGKGDGSIIFPWGTTELSLAMDHLAATLGISAPTADLAAKRGKQIASENQYSLIDQLNAKI